MTAVSLDRPGDVRIAVAADIARDILCAAFAGAIAGVLVNGIGGRIVMRVAMLLNPQAVGRSTENGNIVGDITLGGTFALIIFGGLLTGLLAAPVWTAIASWLPDRGLRRALVAAPIAVALGGVLLVRSDNSDFLILRSDALIVAMLLGLVALFGFSFALVVDWLERRLPRPGPEPREFLLAAASVILFGAVLVLPITLSFYFAGPSCDCPLAPIPLGVPLAVAGVATLAWWAQRTQGHGQPSRPVVLAGRAGLVGAVTLGAVLLAVEVTRIPM